MTRNELTFTIHVSDKIWDTGKSFTNLCTKLVQNVQDTRGIVEEVTGLELVGDLTLHMAHPKDFRQRHVDYVSSVYQRVQDAGMPITVGSEKTMRKATGFVCGLMWRCVSGATLPFPGNDRELIVIPKAVLKHGPLTDEQLTIMIAHELVHVAQNHPDWEKAFISMAGAGFDKDKHNSPDVPELRYLSEGHATWAHQEIARRIYGHDIDTNAKRHSLSSHVVHALAKAVLPDQKAPYKHGEKMVTAAIDLVGIERFNQVWWRPDLVPTKREVESGADVWATRLDKEL